MSVLLLLAATALAATRASSELTNDSGKHPAAAAVDGLLKTGWAEGVSGSSDGAWLELDLGKPTEMHTLSIWPGNLSEGDRSFRECGRPNVVQIYVDDQPVGDPVRLDDQPKRYDVPLAAGGGSVKGRKIKVEVEQSFEGTVFNDLYIAEIAVDFPEGAGLSKLESWEKGKEADKLATAFSAQVDEKYQAYKSAQFGDSAALDFIGDAVADGAPYLRDRVKTLVADGYRAQGLVSSDVAREAARKLKDPNVIPSFRMAQLRAVGDEARRLQDVVEIFEAYQDLIGGANNNVPYWGESGWSPGALKSFNEPLDLDMDKGGNVYVADIGNNRVQRFAENGRPVKQWGPKPDITDAWFDQGRKWYVSGANPGDQAGEFFNPLAIAVIPMKDGDGFAVLDARNRVQIFDPDGNPKVSWTVSPKEQPQPGVGGTAWLIFVPQKDRLYAIIQDQVFGYDMSANQLASFELKDGAPKAACLGPGGKLLFAYGYEVVAYDPDGFRYGTVVDSGLMGKGYEDIDLALDEEEKLWAVTDVGDVIRFKKLGKVDFSIEAVNHALRHPRMVVRDGIVYISSDDRIEVVDALQAHLDQTAADEDESGKGKGKGKDKGKSKPEDDE